MAGSYIQVPADDVGKKVDTVTLTDAATEVHRQKMVVTGAGGTAQVAEVINASACAAAYGLVVRHAGTAVVAGVVVISATCTVAGVISIGGTVAMAGTVNISATATVVGNVSITGTVAVSPVAISGTATIAGTVAISGTVTVAAHAISGTATVVGNVSITGTVAVGPVAISGTATIAGMVGITGTAVVAGIVTLSGTATIAGDLSVTFASAIDIWAQPVLASASRGPRCTLVSTSANVTLVSAPGAGMTIVVTGIYVSNASGNNSRFRCGTSASIGRVTMMMAASGGGFCMNLSPPFVLSSNEHLVGSVKPNISEAIANINFYVASADNL